MAYTPEIGALNPPQTFGMTHDGLTARLIVFILSLTISILPCYCKWQTQPSVVEPDPVTTKCRLVRS